MQETKTKKQFKTKKKTGYSFTQRMKMLMHSAKYKKITEIIRIPIKIYFTYFFNDFFFGVCSFLIFLSVLNNINIAVHTRRWDVPNFFYNFIFVFAFWFSFINLTQAVYLYYVYDIFLRNNSC